ncbi:MAG: hypothetical protein JWM78_2102 [Verrucomicrobiaceae bacterium]|nr:hypothetical protein [Verrucomicrobiaceae bacterium]
MEGKGSVETAFDIYEHVYARINNARNNESNRFPEGHPSRTEYDLSEREKEQLALLRAKLTMEIAKQNHTTILQASNSSDSLARKVFALNIVVATLTAVMAVSAVLALILQK